MRPGESDDTGVVHVRRASIRGTMGLQHTLHGIQGTLEMKSALAPNAEISMQVFIYFAEPLAIMQT